MSRRRTVGPRHDDWPRDDRGSVDRGVTFIELLVSIVLLGTLVVGTLAALRATVIGTAVERDHSKAHEWLQSASEFVTSPDRLTFIDCGSPSPSGADIRVNYQGSLQAQVALVPDEWNASQITIAADVAFAGPSGAYGPTCVDEIDRQLVVIRVEDTDGQIVEEVEVIKAAP